MQNSYFFIRSIRQKVFHRFCWISIINCGSIEYFKNRRYLHGEIINRLLINMNDSPKFSKIDHLVFLSWKCDNYEVFCKSWYHLVIGAISPNRSTMPRFRINWNNKSFYSWIISKNAKIRRFPPWSSPNTKPWELKWINQQCGALALIITDLALNRNNNNRSCN